MLKNVRKNNIPESYKIKLILNLKNVCIQKNCKKKFQKVFDWLKL